MHGILDDPHFEHVATGLRADQPEAREAFREASSREVSRLIVEIDAEDAALCADAGHHWVPAGGGMMICAVCQETDWAENLTRH